jgi:hypothetical protein
MKAIVELVFQEQASAQKKVIHGRGLGELQKSGQLPGTDFIWVYQYGELFSRFGFCNGQ